jgi:1,4-dihydroxy-2-naphthoate octaprenyltransferase
MHEFKNIIRALRLPFLSASILPFILGSLIDKKDFYLFGFFCGLVAVAATHLSANLINDYADSKSGADWQDRTFYKFFGGSKLIQEKILSEKFYLRAAIIFASIAFFSVVLLSLSMKSLSVIIIYLIIIALSWSYSHKPLEFSYHRLGEAFIFILFGPALVMGGYFIQTRIFPDLKSFLMSLPPGFLVTAILFANEVPDYSDDLKAGKFTWVSITGAKYAFLFYYLLIALAFASILLNASLGYLKPWVICLILFIIPAAKAGMILRDYPDDKMRLMDSAKLTIALQVLVSLGLVMGLIL